MTDVEAKQGRRALGPVQRRVSTPSRPNTVADRAARSNLPQTDLPRRRSRRRRVRWGAARRAGRVVVRSCEAARGKRALKLRGADGAEATEGQGVLMDGRSAAQGA